MNQHTTVFFKNKISIHFFFIIGIISLCCLFTSCDKKQDNQEEKAPSVMEVTSTEIIITDMDGDVFIKEGEEFIELFEDDIIVESDVIKTGMDSYCELQFGELAVIRVQEDSILQMNSILTEIGKADITLGLNLGTILCKVDKLVEDERFQVEAAGTVCGVRGTKFGIEVNKSEDISLYVEEGACAIIPIFIAPDTISGKLANNPELAQILNQEVEENVLMVRADQEVTMSKTTRLENEKKFEDVKVVLSEIAQKEEVDEQDKAHLTELFKTSAKAVITQGSQVSTVSVTHKTELTQIDKIKKVEIKVKTKELNLEESKKDDEIRKSVEDTEPQEEKNQKTEEVTQKDKKEAIKNQKITIHTDPVKAHVYINGELIGETPLTVNDRKPGIYEIRIEKEGYNSIVKEVELTQGNDQFYNLILVREGPVLSRVSIHSNPEKAAAYFNGEYLGKTPCVKENVEFGEYEVMLQLRGYSSISQTIVVNEKDKKGIYTLKPENLEVAVLTDILDFIGPPDNYSPEQIEELRGIKSHDKSIDLIYYGRFYFEIIDLHLTSILFTGDKKDFIFYTDMGINSTRGQIEENLGQPSAILAEGKLLRYSKKGITIEIDTEGLASLFRLYRLDPLLTLKPLETTDSHIAEFFSKLKEFPAHFGIE